jgi:peptidoglycan/LPS O-acetylase OafA/YrhL
MTLSAQPLMIDKPATSTSSHLQHIRELDGVRGIAALMVFFHHVCFASLSPVGWNQPVHFLWTISSMGDSGVDLFFVLSGFLITSLLLPARESPAYYHDFYWKRALRILPLYILCMLGVLFFVPGSRGYVILCALFLSNFAWLFHVGTAGPFWTLAIEEQFYLIWPTVVRRRSVAELRHWALGIGLTAVLLRFVAAAFGHYNFRLTFFRCDALAFGAVLACWLYQRDRSRQNSAKENGAIALAFFAGIFLSLMWLLPAQQPRTIAYLAAFRQTGITLLSGSIIAFLITHTGRGSISWLRSPLLTFFGLISYAMYMTHMYVLMLYDHLRGQLQPGDYANYIVRIVAVLAATIVLCLLTRYLIELPAMSLRKYVLSKSRS